jgi:hypothetical protein
METGSRLTGVISQAVRSPDCIFPRKGKRPHCRRLGWPGPVSGQQLPAILSFGRGFRAPVSARYFPISVPGERRLVRLLAETSSARDRGAHGSSQ